MHWKKASTGGEPRISKSEVWTLELPQKQLGFCGANPNGTRQLIHHPPWEGGRCMTSATMQPHPNSELPMEHLHRDSIPQLYRHELTTAASPLSQLLTSRYGAGWTSTDWKVILLP